MIATDSVAIEKAALDVDVVATMMGSILKMRHPTPKTFSHFFESKPKPPANPSM